MHRRIPSRAAGRVQTFLFAALIAAFALAPAAHAAGNGSSTNGQVWAIAPDGSGGSYIGGDFTEVNGVSRNRLAHIKPDGTLNTSWNPNVSGSVRAISVSGSKVYFGGSFSTVGGTARRNAAAVNVSDGSLDSWNPTASNVVRALEVVGSTVYFAGDFLTVGGQTRNRAAAVGTDGTLGSWNPNISDGSVRGMSIGGSNVYLSGTFTTVGGQTRNRAAAVGTDGTLQSWNPNLNNTATSVFVSGSTVYLGGDFSTVGGTSRTRAAAVGTDGTLQPWNPILNGDIRKFAVSGSTIYFVGAFTTVGGTTRNRAAATTTDGTLTSWNPNLNNSVQTVSVVPTYGVSIGGQFTTLDGAAQDFFAGPSKSSATLDTGSNNVTKGTTIKGSGYSFTEGAQQAPTQFRWQRCLVANDDSSCSDMTDGTSSNYGGAWYGTRDGDIGYQVRLKTFWDTVTGQMTAFSLLSGIIDPSGTVAPAITQGLVSGAPKVGTQLRSSFGTWNGYINGVSTVTFQWQSCTSDLASSCTDIPSAVAQLYRPTVNDSGKRLRIVATLTTRGRTAQQASAITGVVAPTVTLDTGSNAVTKGTTIKSSGYSTSWSSSAQFRWQRCLVANDESSCSDMTDGSTTLYSGAWYGTRDADIGYQVRLKTFWDSITVFSPLSGFIDPSGTVAPAYTQGLVSGAPKVGTQLRTSFGTWNGFINGVSTVTFQWQTCTGTLASSCSNISGRTGQTYTPVAGDAGKRLRVVATLNTRGRTAQQASAITNVVAPLLLP